MISMLLYVVNAVSPDCAQVIQLGNNLRMPSHYQKKIDSNCCTGQGVTCTNITNIERVTSISWTGLQLTGTVYGQQLPVNLTRLILSNNSISEMNSVGNFSNSLKLLDISSNQFVSVVIPTSLTTFICTSNKIIGNIPLLPAGLTFLDLSLNQFTGSIPTLPTGLNFLDVSSNQIAGNIPTLPGGLTTFFAFGNKLSGSLPILPPVLAQLKIYTNSINGSLPDILPLYLRVCFVQGNLLTGTIPLLPPSLRWAAFNQNQFTGSIKSPLPNSLAYLILYGNSMSGDLPVLPRSLQLLYLGSPNFPGNQFTGTVLIQRPSALYINSNYITDVIVSNSSLLTLCDLSNNPLFGNQNIANLTQCRKSGLYPESVWPKTMSTFSKGFSNQTTLRSPVNELQGEPRNVTVIDASAQYTDIASDIDLTQGPGLVLDNYEKVNSDLPNSMTGTSMYVSKSQSWTYASTVTSFQTAEATLQSVESSPSDGTTVIYLLIAGIAGIFLVLLVTRRFLKNPASKSKFGRKGSFGTLNTVATTVRNPEV